MSLFSSPDALQYSTEYLTELGQYPQDVSRIADKTPHNFLRIGLIKSLFPNARIIHCKRNPLDTCTSIFLNYFAQGNEYSFDLIEIGQHYLDYRRMMDHWCKLFPTDILNIEYEGLVSDQEKTRRTLIAHIGLEWDEKCLEFYKNRRAVLTTSNLQVRKPIYDNSINRWKKYEQHLEPLISVLSALSENQAGTFSLE